MPKTYFQLLQDATQQLKTRGQETTAAAYLLTERLGWNQTQLLVHYQSAVPDAVAKQFAQDLAQFEQDVPAQYIIGRADFYGHSFQVTPATLIPRPETEELVEWALNTLPNQPLQAVDIGTGTGAIAVSLKLERPAWQLTATDLSASAVQVARANAAQLGAKITFKQGDLFAPLAGQQFDLIISNPPYIAASEKAVMDASVLKYEPQGALFAPEDGLQFYRRFAQQAQAYLRPHGWLFLEYGYHQQDSIAALFKQYFPALKLHFRRDIAGHPRMMAGQLAE
ncbi:hypothetical protein IV38_GL000186 [Lactobacillus selangorensis]|uniref:Release factor glutamine methyltransferase n=1 Tax=Lactobacillus selangorensis TaxID=81857 RepID=A0A0R2FL59_9LACO|nr:peptide chain release factor N(5)-glutamine methyltransferase [Lactobacillus selangorensis]KRN29304.1 hypothetical protein IV38_GL000186 [Lactobacillus selangorensis]KRN34167.1 hypothetical protein IV40_GL000483 [Lactobacillus selangorensis]